MSFVIVESWSSEAAKFQMSAISVSVSGQIDLTCILLLVMNIIIK